MTFTSNSATPESATPDDTSGEDKALTAFLNEQIAAILSPHYDPRPDCPRCGGQDIATERLRPCANGPRPFFRCRSCNDIFNRLYGSPLDGRLYLAKLDVLIPLLSQQLTLSRAGALLGSHSGTVKERVLEIRRWLLRLDLSGYWESRVRLGGRLAELGAKPLLYQEVSAREDAELTQRLTKAFDDINSDAAFPVPPCPHCGNLDNTLYPSRQCAFPRYVCAGCKHNFSRRTGTAFGKTRRPNFAAMRATIRYLALPLPLIQVADETGQEVEITQLWKEMFVALADALEPGGTLSARIRLGVKPTVETPCTFCGRAGHMRRTSSGHCSCAGCGRLFSMRRAVIERNGLLEIVSTPSLSGNSRQP